MQSSNFTDACCCISNSILAGTYEGECRILKPPLGNTDSPWAPVWHPKTRGKSTVSYSDKGQFMSTHTQNLNVGFSEANRRYIYMHIFIHTYIYKLGVKISFLWVAPDLHCFKILDNPSIKIYLLLEGFTLRDWLLSRCLAVIFLRKVMTFPWYPLQKCSELCC